MNSSLTIILEVEDTIVNWVFTHFPTITTCITLIIITCWFTWWARGRFIDYRNDFRKIRSDCNQLDQNQIVFNKALGRIDKKLDTLIIHLSSTKKIDANLFKSQSPIELSDTGAKILVEMGGKTYVDTYLKGLLVQMESQEFKSGLDVQNYCTVLLNEKINDNELIPIKNYIFRRPMYKVSDTVTIPLDITVAITIMGIYLRNRYFEKHPELRTGM